MHPAAFEYLAPASLEEAIALLAERPDAKVLAGGQSLIPVLKLRLGAPGLLVDLRRVDGLRGIREVEGGVEIGALTTYREASRSPLLAGAARAVAEASAAVGDAQVRNRGTVGGALAHADPAGDVPAAVLAAGGSIVARGPGGERVVPAEEFFLGPWTTALAPDELLTAVRLPIPAASGGAYEKLEQKASGFALVGAAAVVGERGVRVAVTGIGTQPILLGGVDGLGARPDPGAVADACRRGAEALADPAGDLHASSEYRRAMVAVIARRAILRAMA